MILCSKVPEKLLLRKPHLAISFILAILAVNLAIAPGPEECLRVGGASDAIFNFKFKSVVCFAFLLKQNLDD